MNTSQNSVSPLVKLQAEEQNLKLLLAYTLEHSLSASYSEIQAMQKSIRLCKGRISHYKSIIY